jgi:hypothetical protein
MLTKKKRDMRREAEYVRTYGGSRLLGFRPDSICEPEAAAMAALIGQLRARVD